MYHALAEAEKFPAEARRVVPERVDQQLPRVL